MNTTNSERLVIEAQYLLPGGVDSPVRAFRAVGGQPLFIDHGQGATIVPWRLREERSWAPDVDELRRLVTPRTRLIAVCNPNNPTGSILSEEAMGAIVSVAEGQGAWLLSDEVYRGAELDGGESPSFWGRYDRVLVACGLSKAYGLPGLRIGWLAGPAPTIAATVTRFMTMGE